MKYKIVIETVTTMDKEDWHKYIEPEYRSLGVCDVDELLEKGITTVETNDDLRNAKTTYRLEKFPG